MAVIRKELFWAAVHKSYALLDYNIQDDLKKEHEFQIQIVLADKSLTDDEKSCAIKELAKDFDNFRVRGNKGTKRICENCQHECSAKLYCEHCVRNYLKANFSNWTSGNDDVDNLIQRCQLETLRPDRIVEWIPYNNLKNIKYLTQGGCVYTADWINGKYEEWDSKEKRLKRLGAQQVVLRRLENVENANRSWLDEGISHLTMTKKYGQIVPCYGLSKDPSDGNYFLVINRMDINLRNYLQQNQNNLPWNLRLRILFHITYGLSRIHVENAIHRNLHSGNILFNQAIQRFHISDLKFCGPADKSLNIVYGNLPFIAPEVLSGKETTFASDIYSMGMLMWEISSAGEPPFANFDHNRDLAMNIVNGMRPRIVPGTPLEYRELMEQCWDADPTKRPDAGTLYKKIEAMHRSYYHKNESEWIGYIILQSDTNPMSSSTLNSRIYTFKDFPKPKNATGEEQEAYHSIHK